MTLIDKTTPRSGAWLVLFALWSLIAAVAAAVLPAPRAPGPVRLLLIVGPVVLFILALRSSTALRQTLAALNPRWLIAAHGIRAVIGAAFLIFGRQGLVPGGFALHAGVGDVIAGVGAVLLMFAYPRLSHPGGRTLLLFWNILGIIDFMNVQRVIAFTFAGRGNEFVAMQRLPMALVPYWGVPLLWSIHVYLIWRHVAQRPRASAPAQAAAR